MGLLRRGHSRIWKLQAIVIAVLIALGVAVITTHVVRGGPPEPPGGIAAYPPAKQTFESQLATREVPRGSPAPRNRAAVPLQTPPPLPVITGIIESGQSYITGMSVTNQWAGVIGGERVRVYAGAPSPGWGRDDPAQGLLVVETDSPDGYTPTRHGGKYLTPHLDGALRITSAQGNQLTLRAIDGRTFTFDAASRTLSDTSPAGFAPLAPTATATPGEPFISVEHPSPAGGLVQVPVSTTGQGFPTYRGFNIHLRWDPALFRYSSASSTGSVIPSPICAFFVDTDGGGVIFGCTATGDASTSAAGLLAIITLQPIGVGCSGLHLFSMLFDRGNASTGTYLIGSDSMPLADYSSTLDWDTTTSGELC
jgi:hypothetical protein